MREDVSSLKQAQPICSSAGGRSMLASCKATGASLDVIEKHVEDSYSNVPERITDNPFDGVMLETRGEMPSSFDLVCQIIVTTTV